MFADLLREGTVTEIAQILLLLLAIAIIVMAPVVWIAGKTVGLTFTPARRAFWTALPAYLVAAVVFIFAGFVPAWTGPFIPMPGAIAIYFWLLLGYRRAWVDEADVHDGVKLENADWRIGLGVVVAVILAAAIKVSLRH